MADLAFVIKPGTDDRGIKARHRTIQRGARQHPVLRHPGEAAAVDIVKRQPQMGNPAAPVRHLRLDPKEPQDRGQDAAKTAPQGQDRRQRPDVMRGVGKQAIPLFRAFADQTKLPRLKVFQPAMHQPRRPGRGTGAKVGALQQQAVHTLRAEIAKRATAIDATAKDQDIDVPHLSHRAAPP